MRSSRVRVCLLVLAFTATLLTETASSQTSGGVSSGLPTSSSNSSAEAKDPKALPWKFLAAPMGLLDTGEWAEYIKNFGNKDRWSSGDTQQRVEALINQTIGKLDVKRAPYVAIHVVDYAPKGTSDASLSDRWYLYRLEDKKKWSYEKFIGEIDETPPLRIYGSPSLSFLFIHLNAKGVSEAKVKAKELPELNKALNSADPLESLSNLCADQSDTHFQPLGAGAITTDYAKVHYESAVVKKTAANIANFLNVLKLLGLAAQSAQEGCKPITTEPVIMWGAGRIDRIGLPSEISIAGYAVARNEPMPEDQRASKQIGSLGAYNDEQLYWWDASIGIPVHKIKDLQYSVSDGQVVATQVDRQSAYAFFNLMLWPANLSDLRSNRIPRLLVGFPLSSSPWDRLFAGAGVGIPWKPVQNFQFFAGATFNRNKQPETLKAGDPATDGQLQGDLKIKFTPKFTFGINVPVLSVFDKLMK